MTRHPWLFFLTGILVAAALFLFAAMLWVDTTPEGWVTEEGVTYYYKDGEPVTGFQDIDGERFCFDETGGLQAGVFRDGDFLQVFTEQGVQKEEGLFTWQGEEYLGDGSGGLLTGYQIIDGKYLCWFDPDTGAMRKGGEVGHLAIPEDGRLPKVYVRGYKKLQKLDGDLEKVLNYCAYDIPYSNSELRLPTCEELANYGFKNKTGNCYVKAGMFYIMAKIQGEDVRQMKGDVLNNDPHSWIEVERDGKTYVCDPSFQEAWPERNGYMFEYKTEGTYRYTNIEVFQD